MFVLCCCCFLFIFCLFCFVLFCFFIVDFWICFLLVFLCVVFWGVFFNVCFGRFGVFWGERDMVGVWFFVWFFVGGFVVVLNIFQMYLLTI